MALTTTEEAQLRQLLDQQSQLLTLAAQQSTISSKLSATKKNLSQLDAASSVSLSDISFVRQGSSDKQVTYQVNYDFYKAAFDDAYLPKVNPSSTGEFSHDGNFTLEDGGYIQPSSISFKVKTASTNGNTIMSVEPDGTGTLGGYTFHNGSDLNNSNQGAIWHNGGAMRIINIPNGSAVPIPTVLEVRNATSGTDRVTIQPNTGTGQNRVELAADANTWTAISDENAKTDFGEIKADYEWFKTVRTVTGRYKTDPEGTVRSFLIAQDWEGKPELVHETDVQELREVEEVVEPAKYDEEGNLVSPEVKRTYNKNAPTGEKQLALADTKTLPHAYAIIKGLIGRVEKLEIELKKRRSK